MYSITCNTDDCNKENNLKKPTHICIHTHTHTQTHTKGKQMRDQAANVHWITGKAT